MNNKIRLLTPGPTPLPEVVRLALARDMIHHRKNDFREIMLGLQPRLGALFGTSGPVLPLACSGTGAMTAAVYSLFRQGDRVLVVEAGKFGERWREIAQSRGLDVEVLKVEWGRAVSAEQVAARVSGAEKGVLLQVCETSTGVLQPVAAIAKAAHAAGALLVADGVSAVGISPCPMDEWQIDCLITGSQKGLMLPPGLALLALSAAGWKAAESAAPGCFYFNLPRERDKLAKGETLFTTPINLIYGLDAAMDLLLKDGLEKIYAKQWALAMLARTGVKAIGLECFAGDNFAWGLTSVRVPEGIDAGKILAEAYNNYGVCMAGGQDALKGKIIRIGHMGWVDWGDCLAGLLALDRGIAAAGGYSASRDYLEQAMAAYSQALAAGAGVMPNSAAIRA